MSERWRISLFGGLEATRGECRIVRFPTRHAAALLAFLALHLHRSHPRAPLAALLWPDAQETTARHRLSQALTSLRALLCLPPTPLLLSGRDRVQLNPDAVSIDVQAFTTALQLARRAPHDPERVQALDRALDLYSAPLLPERTEEWLIPEREAFAEQYFLALQEAAGLLDKLGEPEAAIARLRRGVAIDPLREEAQRALIGLLLETGQRDGAWRQYRSFEQALARELGAEPSAPTQALVAAIRSRPAPAAAAAPRDTEGTETERRAGRPPAPRTRFFGREAEIATLLSWLGGESGERLVTLTGAGGSGKTRLALEVARRLGKEAGTRVVWTHLADLVEAGQIPGAIRDALGLAPEPGRGALEHVIVHLERHPAVLVLDNYEHLVEEGACVVARLLGEAESVRCLVTSRQRLDLSGERECPVAPLPAPEAPPAPAAALASRLSAGEDLAVSREASAESLLAYASVALFMDRARGVRPDFALTPANVAAVGAICARLEGLPLAIELAAARVRLLTPEELLGRLERQLEVLTGGPRDAPGRQRTLRATIAWSYGLLEQEERPLFRRLGVFAGGWTLAAAERVCGAEGLLDHLAGLVERSLVEVVDGSGVTRYRMLEMIREFALERLAESGEKAAVRERHAAAYLAIAEDAREQAEAGAGGDWRKRVAPEEGNLRAALDWSEEQHQIERALRLATLLSCVLTARGRQEEAQERLSRLLARVDASVDRTVHARALTEATEVARARGDARAARAFGEADLAIRRELNDRAGEALALRTLGLNVGDLEGELRLSCRYYEESLKLFEEIGDLGKIAYSLGALGIQYQSMGDTDAACRSWERCLAIQRELNQPIPVTVAHDRLAQIHAQRGDFVAACAHVRARLSLRRELARDRGLSPPPPSEPHEGCHAPDAAMLRALWEADLALERVLEGPEGGGVPLWASIQLAKEQGDFRVAEAHLDTIEAVARRHEARWPEQGTLLRRAEIAQARGDFDAARRWLDMGFTVARGVGNPRLERDLRGFQGILASAQGDTEEARPLLADRAEDYRRQQYWRTLAYWLSLLGLNALRAGELPAARAHLDESRSLLEVATDHELRGSVLAVAGRLCLAEGDPASARSLFEESLAIRRPRRARPGGLECLEGLAAVEAAIGCRELAARTFSACAAERQALGTPIPPADRPAHERRVAALRAALGDAAFVAAWEAGRRLTLEAVWS